MLQSTVAAIEKNGTQVFTFAPSSEASHGVLRSEGFTNAETVERLLIDKEMQKKVNGQLVLIDESGMLSVKDMKRLFDVAKEQNARVLLSGDSDQHHGVTRGDALRILERDAGLEYASLRQIRRQTNETYRSAIAAIAQGDAIGKDGRTGLEAGIDTLDRMGAIIETEGDARYRQIAEDYAQVISERKKDGTFKTALVVAPTHAEIRHVSAAIRETLKAQGKLGAKDREFTVLTPRNLTEAERTIASNYAPGEVVQFHQNAKGFNRGERVTVTGSAASIVTVARADGSKTALPFSEARKFQLYRMEKLSLAKGEKLRITQNGFTATSRRGLGGAKVKDRLNNGALYEVEGFDRQGDIKLTNGFVIPKHYGGLTHGYVVTSHASQGKTVDVPLVALGSESFAAANREQFYVSLSRGREAVRLYTDDKAAMMYAVQASSARLSATELMRNAPATPKHTPGAAMRLYGQVHRAYQRLRERIAAHDLVKAYKAQQHRREELGHGRH